MKKILSVLMAIALALGCTAALAEEEPVIQPAPDPDPFSGVWECDRATIEIVWEEEGYRVLVHWPSSAWEVTTWEYACYYYEEEKRIVSTPFGIRTELLFSDDSDESVDTVVYDDGAAAFYLDEEGYLIWQDEKEDAGKDMRFEYVCTIEEMLAAEAEADG